MAQQSQERRAVKDSLVAQPLPQETFHLGSFVFTLVMPSTLQKHFCILDRGMHEDVEALQSSPEDLMLKSSGCTDRSLSLRRLSGLLNSLLIQESLLLDKASHQRCNIVATQEEGIQSGEYLHRLHQQKQRPEDIHGKAARSKSNHSCLQALHLHQSLIDGLQATVLQHVNDLAGVADLIAHLRSGLGASHHSTKPFKHPSLRLLATANQSVDDSGCIFLQARERPSQLHLDCLYRLWGLSCKAGEMHSLDAVISPRWVDMVVNRTWSQQVAKKGFGLKLEGQTYLARHRPSFGMEDRKLCHQASKG
mmetsp:Transcript_17051/g.39768  ORF Transcript_17051/g.39768 Transcript_17051/m.39768 type:complete len:307 (-) Transcript_17051:364-1284(-)